MSQNVLYSRRATPRAETESSVYVFWYSNGRGDLSRVRNVNLGGLFIETSQMKDLGASIEIYFLVGEGQIRAKAIVRHSEADRGLGLRFTAINDRDRLHFGALMRRLYSARRAALVPRNFTTGHLQYPTGRSSTLADSTIDLALER